MCKDTLAKPHIICISVVIRYMLLKFMLIKLMTMQNLFKILSMLFLLSVISPILSKQLDVLTLKDGTLIQINDDFSWEYVIEEARDTDINETVFTPLPIAPTTTNLTKPAGEVLPINMPPQPEVSNSTDKNGINVRFVNSQWDNNRVGLTFELTSHSEENYVIIALEINLISDKGKRLTNTIVNVWQASYRLPETYLRNKQMRQSRIIWIEGIDKTQWHNKAMNITIKQMKSRG